MSLLRVPESGLIRFDCFAWVVISLIAFLTINIMVFSWRYLTGDSRRGRQLGVTAGLGLSLACLAAADHMLLFLAAWISSSLFAVMLIVHTWQWQAARNAGWLAARSLGIGSLLVGAGFWMLAEHFNTGSLSHVVSSTSLSPLSQLSPLAPHSPASSVVIGLVLLMLAAVLQSGVWPGQRWLLSTLNAPTPSVALLQSAFVSSGLILICRCGPLLASHPALLHVLFGIGLLSGIAGTYWMLLQSDVRRTLACSTVAHMGFALMLAGMGLFAVAMAHVICHALVKTYQILAASSQVQQPQTPRLAVTVSPVRLIVAGLTGCCGAAIFSVTSGYPVGLSDTSSLLSVVVLMATTQAALGLLNRSFTTASLGLALVVAGGASLLYGLGLRTAEALLNSTPATVPQPMDGIYLSGFAFLALLWVALTVNLPARLQSFRLWKRLYLAAVNASQPHPSTVTAIRTTYKYCD